MNKKLAKWSGTGLKHLPTGMRSNVCVYCPLKKKRWWFLRVFAGTRPTRWKICAKVTVGAPIHVAMKNHVETTQRTKAVQLYWLLDRTLLVYSRYTVYRNKKIPFDKDSICINWIPHLSCWIYRFCWLHTDPGWKYITCCTNNRWRILHESMILSTQRKKWNQQQQNEYNQQQRFTGVPTFRPNWPSLGGQ